MPPAPTTSTCTTCGGNSGSCSSCGTAVTTCKLLELIKCMKGFKSCTDKKQIFPIVQATTNFDITVGNIEKCIIQVTFKECKTIEDEIKEKCPELYTLIR